MEYENSFDYNSLIDKALEGYATESWVENKGYQTSSGVKSIINNDAYISPRTHDHGGTSVTLYVKA